MIYFTKTMINLKLKSQINHNLKLRERTGPAGGEAQCRGVSQSLGSLHMPLDLLRRHVSDWIRPATLRS